MKKPYSMAIVVIVAVVIIVAVYASEALSTRNGDDLRMEPAVGDYYELTTEVTIDGKAEVEITKVEVTAVDHTNARVTTTTTVLGVPVTETKTFEEFYSDIHYSSEDLKELVDSGYELLKKNVSVATAFGNVTCNIYGFEYEDEYGNLLGTWMYIGANNGVLYVSEGIASTPDVTTTTTITLSSTNLFGPAAPVNDGDETPETPNEEI